ncbi:hypothetical protein GCM10029964_011950 [Kibdelosporangium lantanae]
MSVQGTLSEAEVEALMELPRLRHLVVRGSVEDYEVLRPLVWSLDVMEFHGPHDSDAVMAALGADAEAEIRIHP